MELYLFMLVILFCTALADLYVGVANDAVNFLNSAIGSKVAKRVTIMTVASCGVLVGTTFSSGMMEVARKGIFNPEMFTFHEVMVVFLAVMITDIILLDLYNTFSLPTSTTVSIVFELLGGAVALSVIKVSQTGGGLAEVLELINTERVLTIVSGIGLSIIFAFIFGVAIQFITRMIFTFDYEKTFRRYGSLYCGAALTAISYFILVKGVKGSVLISEEHASWITSNLTELLLYIFVAWTVFWQLIISLTRISVLKVIVLIGTFVLALAFAANDLVNFVGAPLGALNAFQIASSNGGDPMTLTMEGLTAPVRANMGILLIAGVVMVGTLWYSKKARSVTKTEVTLGRQDEGVERFESSALSRSIVRMSLGVISGVQHIVPVTVQRRIAHRLDASRARPVESLDGAPPSFDLLRAAVNLMVASMLISLGTSLKLPLSTTFVTFMVAMSTSLADRAWGRESAVYRVNGVITVIGGWFFTAMLAFSACFGFAFAIYYGEVPAIIGLVAFGFFFFYRTNRLHTRREKEFERLERKRTFGRETFERFDQTMREISHFLTTSSETIHECYNGLMNGNRSTLKNTLYRTTQLSREADEIVMEILDIMKESKEEERGAQTRYARKIASLQIITANLTSLANASYTYVDNNHTPPDEEQSTEMREVRGIALGVLESCVSMLKSHDFHPLAALKEKVQRLKETIREYDRHQMKRIRAGVSKTRQSLLFIGTLNKVERIADQAIILAELYQLSLHELKEEN